MTLAPPRLTLAGRRLSLVSPARMYLCGITPYDVTHLGHAATFVWADAAVSIMRLTGVDVLVCRNVTDVDDVLSRAAARRRRSYDDYAVTQEYLFDQDMAALRVRQPTYAPRARRHVDRMIQFVGALLDADRAYQRDGYVHFRGGPVHRDPDVEPGTPHEEDGGRPDDPADVAVWRPSGPADPGWPSPWGFGRPGWHAECAALAVSVLGPGVDVVAGGADLAFPHHAYQAAMVEAATGVAPFGRARLSVGVVRIGGEKMAKSTGNLVLVSELLRDHPPAVLRLLLLDRVWHRAWDYRPGDLDACAARLDRLYAAAGRPGAGAGGPDAVTAALLDDLDTPTALAIAEEAGGEAARLVLRALALA